MRLADALVDLRPLRSSPAFRRLWVSTMCSAIGGQLAFVAVLVQVWQVSESELAVGAVGLARAVPIVVFGLVGGTLADSLDRRRLVLLTTTGQFLSAGLLAAQALTDHGSLLLVLGLVAVQAACGALGMSARKAFVVALLPEQQVAAGVALNHIAFQAAMLVGPAVGGLLAARSGIAACYLVDALTFGVAFYGVLRLPAIVPTGGSTRPGMRAIWQGWRFISRTPTVGGAFMTDLLATVMAMPIALFPAINQERFGGNPLTLGLFLSSVAMGGIVAGTTSGTVTRLRRPGMVMLVAAGVWGLSLVSFGLVRSLWLTLGWLTVAGAADTVSVISRGTLVQLATPDSHRGRVSSVDYIVGAAGPDIGNFRGGLVAGITSAPFAIVSGGAICALGVVGLAGSNRSLRRFTTAGSQTSSGSDETTSQVPNATNSAAAP